MQFNLLSDWIALWCGAINLQVANCSINKSIIRIVSVHPGDIVMVIIKATHQAEVRVVVELHLFPAKEHSNCVRVSN